MIYIYDIYDIFEIYDIYIYIKNNKKCMVWYTSFKPGTLLALMPKEPIDCFAKVLPCSAASAAVFSESVLAGASSAGEGWRKKVLLDFWMSFMTHKPGNTISNHFDCMGKQGTSFRWTEAAVDAQSLHVGSSTFWTGQAPQRMRRTAQWTRRTAQRPGGISDNFQECCFEIF